MLTLYYSPGSCSLAPRIVLEDIGEPYGLNRISIPDGEQHAPAFLAINPRGRIPVLTEGDDVLVENVAILAYLARRSPDAQLFQDDPRDQAECLSVMVWLSNTVQPGFSRVFRPQRISADEAAHDGIKSAARDFCWENLREIDTMLDRREWIVGKAYTVADPLALVFYAWGLRIELPVDELTAYTRFKDAMLRRDSTQTVLRDENSILLAP